MQERTFELRNATQKMYGSKWRTSRTSAVTPVRIAPDLMICYLYLFKQCNYIVSLNFDKN